MRFTSSGSKMVLTRDDTGTIPNFLNFTVAAYKLADNNCTKIPDWTLMYGINCHFGLTKGIFIHFPFFQTFLPFLINYIYLETLFHFSWSSFFLSEISWFQEISWKVASLKNVQWIATWGNSNYLPRTFPFSWTVRLPIPHLRWVKVTR